MTERRPIREAWVAGLVAALALVASFVGSLVVPGLATPAALVAVPVAAAAAWLYRHELRSGGWRTVAGLAVLAIGLAVVLVPPSYFARLLP